MLYEKIKGVDKMNGIAKRSPLAKGVDFSLLKKQSHTAWILDFYGLFRQTF